MEINDVQLEKVMKQVYRAQADLMPHGEKVNLHRTYEQMPAGTAVVTKNNGNYVMGHVRKLYKPNGRATNVIELETGILYDANPLHTLVLGM